MKTTLPFRLTKILITILLLFCITIEAAAQNHGLLFGFVHDRITKENLFGTKVSLMEKDSVVATVTTKQNSDVNGHKGPWFFDTNLKGGPYVLLFEKDGYNILSYPLNIKPLKKGELRFLADIPLDKAPKQHVIDGVTIKATKVKFYHKGDTLVYDADAFQTAEGSMLDALIKQLPGVELDDNGQIFVNGKKVESLLLNGENFFKGNNQIMLENLPAFMVKTVKTYEKTGMLSQMAGRDMGDKEFVMDINLKKQYQIGWIANAEAGSGSDNRYLGRLFALRFTPQSRLTLYGNFNNLNDTRKPGESSSWTPETMPTGLLATKKGGVDFLVNSKGGNTKYTGNIEVAGQAYDTKTTKDIETFMPSGNTYTRSRTFAKSSNFKIHTSHELRTWSPIKWFSVSISPTFDYSNYHSLSNAISMAFNQRPTLKGMSALIDSLNTGTNNNTLRSSLINQAINNVKKDGHSLNGALEYDITKKMGAVDYFGLSGSLSYKEQADRSINSKYISYPNISGSTDDIVNRKNRNKPNRDLYSQTDLAYQHFMNSNLAVAIMYSLTYQNKQEDRLTYLLDNMTGTDDINQYLQGMLPSERDYNSTLDNHNTSYQTLQTLGQTPTFMLKYDKQQVETDPTKFGKINRITSQLTLPFNFLHERLDYRQYTYNDITRRNRLAFNPSFTLNIQANKYQDLVAFNYGMTQSAPSMTYATGVVNDRDPLNIYHGNAHLHNTSAHQAKISWQHNNPKTQLQRTISASYNISHNAVAMGYIYDRQTGIRTWKPDNVSGNYTLTGAYNLSLPIDKKKRVTLNTNTYGHILHGIDLVSTTPQQPTLRSSVMTYWITEKLKLSYKVNGNLTIGAKGYVGYGHSTSNRQDFNTVNICDFHYGLTSLFTLPYKWQVSTDLTMYCRRGYDSGANNNDLVWNARISKTFTKAGLTLAIDGFDILNQLSNISQTLNSQGKTETWNNSLPRYVMAHVIYRLNKQPKKSK